MKKEYLLQTRKTKRERECYGEGKNVKHQNEIQNKKIVKKQNN